MLACLFVFKIQTILVWGEDHGGKHLQNGALQIPETFQLVPPRVRNDVGKHYGKRPPEAAKKHNQTANVRDHGQRALDVSQELEEGDEEADQQDEIHGLHVVKNLEVVDKSHIIDNLDLPQGLILFTQLLVQLILFLE